MVRNEIGGEFFDLPLGREKNALFPRNISWFRSGRTALAAIIDQIQAQQSFNAVALPSWCCETMIRPFTSRGIRVYFYPVIADSHGHLFQQIPDANWHGCDGILVMDYFGYHRLPSHFGGWEVVIQDVTHSLFCNNKMDADYVYGSLRKWAGFWTGGFAWGQHALLPGRPVEHTPDPYIVLRQQGMKEKLEYLSGAREEKQHLSTFSSAEALLDAVPEGPGDDRDIQAARWLDAAFIKKARRANAQLLLETVGECTLFPELYPEDCPLFVPIRVPGGKRDALRQFLIQQDIYCPAHWPISGLHQIEESERNIYEDELSLVCDQRYTLEDMERICQAIKRFLR